MLLPGLLCDRELWRAQTAALGSVASCQVADLTRDDTIGAMAERVLAHAPARFALAALSMGGYVAFEILRRAPERVERLALLATCAAPDSDERARQRRSAMATLEMGRFKGVTGRMLPQLVHAGHVHGAVGEVVQAMAARVGAEAFLRQQQAILRRPDSRSILPSIVMPTVIGVGDDDRLTPPSEAEELHRGIAGAHFHLFARCGHLPPLECPDETTALLRHWLQP
ncbi:alpha/beta hydrolase fold protein [Novosphingobium nitrogenifigens DSM 19370]|uniref:Alpha/beta hydrolase fold protein n=1 Tax=Novosphingobium nitrogenifigens DSM 19370 TaxID=983920 RepID=F1Z809_9SPHN|nr:alpha/beta hydrolase fold protein [Novosphingobium nitrogenifigens DSM 19370]